jgi:hypothetical protein
MAGGVLILLALLAQALAYVSVLGLGFAAGSAGDEAHAEGRAAGAALVSLTLIVIALGLWGAAIAAAGR